MESLLDRDRTVNKTCCIIMEYVDPENTPEKFDLAFIFAVPKSLYCFSAS